MQMFRRFFAGLQQDLKAFVYWCVVFAVFRLIFIALYSSQLDNVSLLQVAEAMWLGLRLSLKTAGIMMLGGALMATLPHTVYRKWPAVAMRLAWHAVALLFFSICFYTRIPYYQIFNSAFNMMLINGMHDDKYAILVTAINEYQLLWRLPLAVVTGAALALLLRWIWRNTKIIDFAVVPYRKISAAAVIIFLPLFWIFVRYGGAMSYAASINWESAARLNSNLLNEAVLDDGQALYRVYSMKRALDKVTDVNMSPEELRKKIALLGGDTDAGSIDAAFKRTVVKPKLAHQPSNIVVIIGESFGLWPMLPKYQNLGLANESLVLANSPQSIHTDVMLANGTGTISAVNGLVTGLPDAGLYENYQPNSQISKYQMGIGYIMKQMGYKTVFWYGGFPGWQNIEKFVIAQSFDEFYCADDFNYAGGNAWGCPDKELFENVNKYIANERSGEKVLHVILTSSNHPPYSINVDQEGFDREAVRAKLPADISNDDKTLTELGHIWYADQAVGSFVHQAEKLRPDSLFVITGDHSERFTFAKEQDLKTLSAIPCIFYGQGVQQDWFSAEQTGCAIQIAGTLAELAAPAGFTYSAMLPNMFENDMPVFNHRLYAKDGKMELLSGNKDVNKIADAAKSLAAYRVLKEK